jgi:thiol-disulfide isomerase/thioredoxin
MSRRPAAVRAWLGACTALVIIAGLALMEYRSRGTAGIGGFTVADYEAKASIENSPVPDFTFPSLDDRTVATKELRGNVVVINFWASWCGPCRLEAPGLRWVSSHYRREGVRFVGVDERDDPAAAREFQRAFHIPYASAFDPSGRLTDDFRVVGLPTTVVVDAEGTMRYRFTGYLTRDVLEAAVNDVLRVRAS